jgi:hypothetical protein
MAIQSQKIEAHWNYFLAIERDLDVLSRYIEFDDSNFGCFSMEIARIVLAAGAEVDVVCKQICRSNSDTSANGINSYRESIKSLIPDIHDFQVFIPRFGLTLQPWDNWRAERGIPDWWTAYNKIKHHRDSEYHQASLKNALNAVAGLFVMVLYLYKEKAKLGELLPSPQLFRVGPDHDGGFIISGTATYNL